MGEPAADQLPDGAGSPESAGDLAGCRARRPDDTAGCGGARGMRGIARRGRAGPPGAAVWYDAGGRTAAKATRKTPRAARRLSCGTAGHFVRPDDSDHRLAAVAF